MQGATNAMGIATTTTIESSRLRQLCVVHQSEGSRSMVVITNGSRRVLSRVLLCHRVSNAASDPNLEIRRPLRYGFFAARPSRIVNETCISSWRSIEIVEVRSYCSLSCEHRLNRFGCRGRACGSLYPLGETELPSAKESDIVRRNYASDST